MSDKKFVLASQDQIQLHEATARAFFRDVLDLSLDECIVTDETCLSDFSSCGLPEDIREPAGGLRALHAAWDTWLLAELQRRYGLVYTTSAIPLLTLLRDVEAFEARRQH